MRDVRCKVWGILYRASDTTIDFNYGNSISLNSSHYKVYLHLHRKSLLELWDLCHLDEVHLQLQVYLFFQSFVSFIQSQFCLLKFSFNRSVSAPPTHPPTHPINFSIWLVINLFFFKIAYLFPQPVNYLIVVAPKHVNFVEVALVLGLIQCPSAVL